MRISLKLAALACATPALAVEQAKVVARFRGCDYFIADGSRGLFVLEWYGGHDPDIGDKIIGEIGSYGMKDVFYPDSSREGRVWVEDYLLSKTRAAKEIADHCK